MPKIRAATVAEHHAAQRRSLLDAARGMLTNGQIPTLAQVAARTGLARPSVYQYFRSRDDLLIAVLEDALPRWSTRITQSMAEVGDPADRVLAYAAANIELVSEGEHAIVRALATALPGDKLADRARELHDQLKTPLVTTLGQLGAADPEITAELINAIVHSATNMVDAGSDPSTVRARVEELLTPYLEQRFRTSRGTVPPAEG
ncbi:TetR/AcrR family transcriptional regulator [Nocardia higoensis]|uniref:TetR/AcrR family transcriptional regulator n=1 Tax=Nocardia higoensis TaxID=228599 RepID=A0ABS0DA33_9NOCA|nr:TetR/AcrR family transcriptional regulator [Nocardia higoensis]MBF6353608.1 TetR/AcrR family transcriptional regulator [Nocardia higoensis]